MQAKLGCETGPDRFIEYNNNGEVSEASCASLKTVSNLLHPSSIPQHLHPCRRLLHYKSESASALLKSMQMVLRLDPAVAWDLAPAIANEVRPSFLQHRRVRAHCVGCRHCTSTSHFPVADICKFFFWQKTEVPNFCW